MNLHKRTLLLLCAAWAIQVKAEQLYDVKALRDVMVSTRDGVKLGTNIFLPAQSGSVISGRFPVIVERTPYNKDSVAGALVTYYVSRGYAVVIQDVRGRYRSEGRWTPHLLSSLNRDCRMG